MSDAANAAGGASAPSAISGNQKREYVPTPKVQVQTQREAQPSKEGESSNPFSGTKHKVKVDGKDVEIDYETLVRDYQIRQASDRRFQEASQKEKSVQQVQQALEAGDLSFLTQKLGKAKAKELMEDFLIRDLEEEELRRQNPGEARARELEAKLKDREDKDKDDADKRAKAEKDVVLKQAHEDLDKEVGDALRALGRKPTPRLVIRIIDEMMARMDAKKESLPADKASQKAVSSIHEDIKDFLPQLETSELVQVLGLDIVKRISEYQANQLLSDRSKVRTKPSDAKAPQAKKKLGIDEWINSRIKQG